MNILSIFVMSVGGGLISCCTVYACSFWLWKRLRKKCDQKAMQRLFYSMDLKQSVSDQWRELRLENEIEAFAVHYLDELYATFKAKVPLVGMFLNLERQEQIKDQARAVLMELVPALKQRLTEKLVQEEALQIAIVNGIADKVVQHFDTAALKLWKSMRGALFGKAFCLGFCLGFLEAVLI